MARVQGPERIAISVVVPVYNAETTVGRTIAALVAQELDDAYEVIFVDGGSTDGTRELLAAAAGDSLTVLHNPEREPASARNIGARRARGPVLAFTDSDCEPTPGWLAAGRSALADADIVQGKVLPISNHGPFDRTLAVVAEEGLYETANLFVRHQTFDRVGGFTAIPGLPVAFGEDTSFVWRAKRLGARTVFAGDALVHHAVVPRGIRAYVHELRRRAYFPELVAHVPELRRTFLHHRLFLTPASLRFDVAVAGLAVAVARRRPAAMLATVPYAAGVLAQAGKYPPEYRRRLIAGFIAGDAVSFGVLALGSVRARRLVI
jgi:glycosyltransferase involved in cell wall biosynthesis